MIQEESIGASGSAFGSLYRVAGVAALIAAATMLGEAIFLAVYPQPGSVSGWFELFQTSTLIGLLDFWGLEIPMYLAFIVVFLALYPLLRGANRGLMTIALVVSLLGIAIFLATNNPVSMLSLSRQHAAAATDSERAALLTAGQTVLTATNQRAVGGFNMGLFLVSVAGLIVAWTQLRSAVFSKSTAYVGILAYALSLADYVREALTSSPLITLMFVVPNVLLLVTWFVIVSRRLFGLARHEAVLAERSSAEAVTL